jgi:transmembrane sensor
VTTFDETRREQAAQWFATQRRGLLSDEEHEQLLSWSADPRNRAVLEEMRALWKELSGLKSPTRERTGSSTSVRARAGTRHERWPLALAAGLALAVPGMALWWWQIHSQPSPSYAAQTGIGEQRGATLPDGSHVDLNVVTRLDYRLDNGQRNVRLADGEALFFVHEDAAHPFIVRAGDYEIRALGTAFDVCKRDGVVEVKILEGAVSVESLAGLRTPGPVARLSQGERLSLGTGAAGKIERIASQEVAEWREHRVSYEDIQVAQVVADLNRFFPRPLRVLDPTLADSKVTLTLQLNDRQQTLRTLSALLGVRIRSDAEGDELVAAE